MNDIIYREKLIKGIDEQFFNNIFKIENTGGTGFFCKIPFPDNLNRLPILFICYHNLSEKDIKPGQKINIKFDNDKIETIEIDSSTKTYTSGEKEYNVTMIEIKDNIKFNVIKMFEIDKNIFLNNNLNEEYKNKSIYIINYSKDGEKKYLSPGLLKAIDNSNITIEFNDLIEDSISGSPILIKDSYNVIGINLGKNNKNVSNGILIKDLINKFIEKYKNKSINLDNKNNDHNNNLLNLKENLNKIIDWFISMINYIKGKKFFFLLLFLLLVFIFSFLHISIKNYFYRKDKKIYINEDKYNDEFKYKRKNGKEIIYYNNGDRYEGDWKNGKREGKGIIYYKINDELNRMKYDGEWKNNNREGKGTLYWNNGDRYEGEWMNDKKEGKGKIFYYNDEKYEGEWKNNKREGKGIYYWNNGDKYDGEWKNDNKEGKGTYYWNNGVKYDGEWKNDNREGKGTLYLNDGYKYEGKWKNDRKEGFGIYYFNNRIIEFMEFKEDKRVDKNYSFLEY